MIDFKNRSIIKLKQTKETFADIQPLLISWEEIIDAYKGIPKLRLPVYLTLIVN